MFGCMRLNECKSELNIDMNKDIRYHLINIVCIYSQRPTFSQPYTKHDMLFYVFYVNERTQSRVNTFVSVVSSVNVLQSKERVSFTGWFSFLLLLFFCCCCRRLFPFNQRTPSN